jgi:hypothetical protein
MRVWVVENDAAMAAALSTESVAEGFAIKIASFFYKIVGDSAHLVPQSSTAFPTENDLAMPVRGSAANPQAGFHKVSWLSPLRLGAISPAASISCAIFVLLTGEGL